MATVSDKDLEDLLDKCSAWLPNAMEQELGARLQWTLLWGRVNER